MASPLPFNQRVCFSLALLSAAACAEEPWVYRAPSDDLSVGGEIYRVFCKRTAKDAAPTDITGTQFDKLCVGEAGLPLLAESPARDRLAALAERRERVVNVVDRVLGEANVTQRKVVTLLEQDEIRTFLREITPLYDTPEELLPGATRNLGAVLGRLANPADATGAAALQGLSQITGRKGYRPLDLALGLLRPLLQYRELDAFAENGLKVIARGGLAEQSLDELSLGLSLELANYDQSPPAPDSTLLIARDLFLSPIDQTDQPARAPIWITRRDARGVAVPFGASESGVPAPFVDGDGDKRADVDQFGRLLAAGESSGQLPAPYRVAGEPEGIARDEHGRAMSGGQPLYADFDAQSTLAAAFLREQARLTVPVSGDRTALEKVGRGLSALFGLSAQRSAAYGKAKVSFTGPDPATGAIHDLVHAIGAAVRTNPDAVRRVLQLLQQGMQEHEHELSQFVQTLVNLSERGKLHPEAALVGEAGPGTPHRFWDDLLAIGLRMTRRPGMIEDLIRMITKPEARALGPIIATWMQYKDLARYQGADFTPGNPDGTFTAEQETNLNAEVSLGYTTEVDRGAPDVENNRSVWQQTMSMVHNLSQPICNKEGAVLHLVRSSATDPLGQITGTIHDFPWSGGGYKKCELFEVPHMIRIWVQSILGTARIDLKPADLLAFDTVGFVSTGRIQEIETQITGFNARPSPVSFARFLYGPPNQFTEKMKPDVLMDGARAELIDPYALFAMEVRHPDAMLPGANRALNFLEAGKPMVEVFESHELVDADGNLTDGYLFADLLNVFHMHWAARREDPCTGPTACTQHTDPAAPFFSYQTDLRSYEPLLAEALREERLIDVLADATNALASISIDGKDGVKILAEFVELLLTPSPDLTYRDGATSAKTNLGEELGYVSPLYLALDGLKRIDSNFAAPEHAGHVETWREGRSDLVDLFLAVEVKDNQKRLKDRVGRAVFLTTLEFLQERIVAHQTAQDLPAWAAGLAQRSVTFFDTPLIAGLLHLFEKSWDEPASGRELMKFLHYLSDEEENPVAFKTLLVAVADLLQLMEDSAKIAPILHLAGEAVAPGAPALLASGTGSADTHAGLLRRLVELQNRLLSLHPRRPSTLVRVAQNLVNTEAKEDQTPVETFVDIISELERESPRARPDEILTLEDLRAIAASAHTFLTDDAHGVERLYDVIQNRTIHPKPPENKQDQP